MEDPQILGVTI